MTFLQWAHDISPKKYEMYKAFFPDADLHYQIGDIYNINSSAIPVTTLATCSFPCIDLSLAGNREGINGRHSSVFWGFVQALKGQGSGAPPIVLVENVPGWLSSNDGADFRLTVKSLNDLGYACDVFVLDARRFVPQSRLRVFLVGARLPLSEQGCDDILQRPHALLPDLLRNSVLANRDLRWFASPLPAPPPLRTEGLQHIIEDLSDADMRWWSETEVSRHFKMMSGTHQAFVSLLVETLAFTYRTFYRRKRADGQRAEVRSDDIAGCLRTAVGGSGKQFLIKAGYGRLKMRTMTALEYARLQGVPDQYPITVDGVQALTGFGDAVCVPAITWVAQHALNPLVKSYLPGVKIGQAREWVTI